MEAILFFYFFKPSVSKLYRNVRFVLKTKKPFEVVFTKGDHAEITTIFFVSPQYHHTISPVVYFHFERDQCWINHGAQFVKEELTFAKVSIFFSSSDHLGTSSR